MAERTAGSVEFYTDARGRNPVAEFIKQLEAREQGAVLRVLDLLQEYGVKLGLPHARPIDGLWELRAGACRIFYVSYPGRRFILLHAYYKKSQQAPLQEIATARRRLADFLESEGAER